MRHRGVEIGPYEKKARQRSGSSTVESDENNPPKVATIRLTLRIENSSKFVRGKKQETRAGRHRALLPEEYEAERLPNGEYMLKVPYNSDDDLDTRMSELLSDISSEAGDRHCFSESDARMEGTDRHW